MGRNELCDGNFQLFVGCPAITDFVG